MKEYLKACFSFSRKELNGMLVLSGLIMLLLAAQLLTKWLAPRPEINFSNFEREVALLDAAGIFGVDSFARPEARAPVGGSRVRPPRRSAAPPAGRSTSAGPSKEPGGRYSAGGKPEKAMDRSRSAGTLKEPAGRSPAGGKPEKTTDHSRSAGTRKGAPACPELEINAADSVAFLPLRGIGPVLSARIVSYRERLGGFHSVDQLLEVYGLDTAAFRRFRDCLRADSSLVEKIDLNEADYRELRRLPYWSPKQIRVVLNYREQHGGFREISALYNVRALEGHTIQKVIPYLSVK